MLCNDEDNSYFKHSLAQNYLFFIDKRIQANFKNDKLDLPLMNGYIITMVNIQEK